MLAEALARHYQTLWVPEYLREFVDQQQRVPDQREQLHRGRHKRARELEASAKAHQYLFCDTTPVMTALYSRHYFLLSLIHNWRSWSSNMTTPSLLSLRQTFHGHPMACNVSRQQFVIACIKNY